MTEPPIIPGQGEPYSLAHVLPVSPPPTKPPRPGWVVPVLVALVLVLAGVTAWALTRSAVATPDPAASPSAPTPLRVFGHLTLRDFHLGWQPAKSRCEGDGGYSDIKQGARVVITDSAGQTVALDELGAGSVAEPGVACVFSFSADVPPGLKFYGIAIGNRRPYQVEEVKLASSVELTLGDD